MTNRERLIGLGVAAIVGLSVWAPSSAHASACSGDTWTNTKGGSWFEGANWSTKAPPTSTEEACITASGTYTVTVAQGATVSVKSLTVGGAAGIQTLVLASSCAGNATFSTTAGISNEAQGAITLTNSESCGYAVTVTGPLTNSGTITTEPAHGGARTLQGNLTNKGTLAINAGTTFDGSGTTLLNEGALDVAEGVQLAVSNGASFTNGSGGKIVAGASGGVFFEGKAGAFTEGAGTSSGGEPVIVDNGALVYAGAGASAIAVRGESNTLSGSLSSGQSLSIETTCAGNTSVTAASSFTNGGSITLTNAPTCGYADTLVVSSGTLTNSGTITTEPAHGGARTLRGNVTNKGTLAINAGTTFNAPGTTLLNEGALDVSEGVQLVASNGSSVTNGSGGSIAAAGSGEKAGDLLLSGAGTFTEGAGATSGSKPVIVDDAALAYSGAGASAIAVRGESNTLSGSLSSGQSLSIETTCAGNTSVTAASSFSNGGSITLTNAPTCGYADTLVVSSGTLTNSGTITTEPANGGARTLRGNITNTGKLVINANTSFSAVETTLQNNGAIDIATGVALSAPAKDTVENESAGTIAGTGTGALVQSTGTFDEGAGKTTGTEPVILEGVALHYTGSGASTIALRGESTLGGTISSGQELSIQTTCAGNARTSAAAGFLNSGTIDLTNAPSCGYNVTLALPAGATLENKGTIEDEVPYGGARTIEGILKNEKTVSLSAGETLKVIGSCSQGKKGTLKTAIDSGSSYGALSVSGAATLGGTLSLSQSKTFLGKAGESFAVLGSSSRTATFTKESKATIKKTAGLYYKPTYSPTGVTLVVTLAKLALSKSEGAPGSSVTLSGSGYPAEDTIKLSFSDHAKHTTTLASVKTNVAGEFSTELTVPAGAAEGAGKFQGKSTQTGVSVTETFNVT